MPVPHPILGSKSLIDKANIISCVHAGVPVSSLAVTTREATSPTGTGPTTSKCQPRLLLCVAALAYCCLTKSGRLGGLVLRLFIAAATVASACLLGLFLVSWVAPRGTSVYSLGFDNADTKAGLPDWPKEWSEGLSKKSKANSKPSNILEHQAEYAVQVMTELALANGGSSSHARGPLNYHRMPVATRAQRRGKTPRIKDCGQYDTLKEQRSRALQLLAKPHWSPLAFYFICAAPPVNAAPLPGGPADKVSRILDYIDEIWQIALILTPYMVVLWGLGSVVKTLVQSPKPGRPLVSGASAFGSAFAWWVVRCTEDMPTKTEALYLAVFAAFWANFVAYSCRPLEHKVEYVLGIVLGGGMLTLLVSALAFIAGQKADGPDATTVFFSRTYDICPGGLILSSLGMHLWRGNSDHPAISDPPENARYSTRLELGDIGAGHHPNVASSGRETGDIPAWANESYQRGRLAVQGEGDPHGIWRLE